MHVGLVPRLSPTLATICFFFGFYVQCCQSSFPFPIDRVGDTLLWATLLFVCNFLLVFCFVLSLSFHTIGNTPSLCPVCFDSLSFLRFHIPYSGSMPPFLYPTPCNCVVCHMFFFVGSRLCLVCCSLYVPQCRGRNMERRLSTRVYYSIFHPCVVHFDL